MLFVFNKDKIISCTIAASIVIILFIFSMSLIPKSDTELVPISSNITNSIENKNDVNNITSNNIYKNDKIIIENTEKQRKN